MTQQPLHITLRPSDVLRQVGSAIEILPPTVTVTLPMETTCKNAIDAVESTLENDQALVLSHPTKPGVRHRLREIALEHARIWNTESSSPSSGGLRIYTSVDLIAMGPPELPTEETRNRFREIAKNTPTFPDPYPLRLVPKVGEKSIALVPCSFTIRGVDAGPDDPNVKLSNIDAIWDTGAHISVIVEDMLPSSFLEHLKDPIHEPYKDPTGTRVQVSAYVAFSNTAVRIEAVFLVVPKRVVPNERVGVLLGQHSLINRTTHFMTSRDMLRAKGSEISDEHWGYIDLHEYLDVYGKIVKF